MKDSRLESWIVCDVGTRGRLDCVELVDLMARASKIEALT